ncbi:MAG: magnesium/cobalt transporter CorA [Burkholderiaceae bacterium]
MSHRKIRSRHAARKSADAGQHRAIAQLARRAEPGAMPGTLAASADANRTMINTIVYDAGSCTAESDCPVSSLQSKIASGKVLWVDVVGLADVGAIEQIGRLFGIHALALEDVVNTHQRPKVEEFDSHLFVVMKMPNPGADSATEQLSMFFGEGFVLTFQELAGDCFGPVRQRIEKSKGRIRRSPSDYLAYALIDTAIDSYYPMLEQYGSELETLEDAIDAKSSVHQPEKLHRVRRQLMAARRVIWPLREMVSALVREESTLVTESTRVYLRDCYDHSIQLLEIVETYREIAAALQEVILARTSARLNDVMKVLTLISTVFIPLSFITGLFGMNFDRSASPWNMPELGWRFGYPLALSVMALMVLGMTFFFWRKGWLSREAR